MANKSEVIERYENDVLVNTETKSYTYNYMNQLVEAIIDGKHIDYFYDEYGNLIQENDGTTSTYFSYDLKNQMVSYTDGTETLEFEYDGSGNRTEKSINNNTVSYINDITKPNEEVISLTYNSTVTNYTYGLDRLYESNEEYLHDSYGNVVEHASETYKYTPYGKLISGTMDGVNEYGYKGEVHDTESLQYLRARYYHTSLLQFISEDSYTGEDTNPLSQNRYTFVQNNPFKYSDPSGHSAEMMKGFGSSHGFSETKTQETVEKIENESKSFIERISDLGKEVSKKVSTFIKEKPKEETKKVIEIVEKYIKKTKDKASEIIKSDDRKILSEYSDKNNSIANELVYPNHSIYSSYSNSNVTRSGSGYSVYPSNSDYVGQATNQSTESRQANTHLLKYMNNGVDFYDSKLKYVINGSTASAAGQYSLGQIVNSVSGSGVSTRANGKYFNVYGSNKEVKNFFGANVRRATPGYIDDLVNVNTGNAAKTLLGDIKTTDVLSLTSEAGEKVDYKAFSSSSFFPKDGSIGLKNFAKKMPIEKIATGLDYLEVGVDVYNGIQENIESGADTSEFVTDAIVDVAFAAVGIVTSNIITGGVASAFATASIGLLPIIAVAGVGIGVGLIYDTIINAEDSKGKSFKDGIKDGANNIYNSFKNWFGG